MGAGRKPGWVLIREIGLEYADRRAGEDTIALTSPLVAERMQGGGYLVVDNTAEDGPPPERRCRTLLLSATQEVMYAPGHTISTTGMAAG